MKRIKRFGVWQTAMVLAVIYFVFSAVILLPIGLISTAFIEVSDGPFNNASFFLVLPFVYGIIGFLFVALGCAIYNFVARFTGGIEIEVESDDSFTHEDQIV